ncbi:SusC/RagA family TonB-linked outer membrane protein [Formosa sediminum]|uniref:SusC/RagA family TonB-linked outer membrane protein n=1 Tax=Formosa sediminum TaxID=2594004 RepID=A0A516GQI1_9FLAO|nr:SusC/RagA family TonB-linked outer membrane protein [Formosa sediminum]QDO93787.1 SusC/RagA family TonB-linked outer membrane protein [Formosa sediminum]
MKTKFSGILTLFLAFVVQLTFAQEKLISGTVSDEAGLPLPGVNIIIKGTSQGTQSDFDGNYSLSASSGDVLSFSFMGYKSKTITVGTSTTINLTMTEDLSELDEVVVTALGIKRDEKALGYSSQEVSSEQLVTVRDANVVNSLSGKVAGINVTNASGAVGSESRIVIRGISSISGNTQPLIIVDGVVLDNSSYGNSSSSGGNSTPNGLADINQDDIASMNVLKGGAATSLYGMRGANGVIVITTKSGNTKSDQLGIEISSNVSFENAYVLPEYQNSYGQGFDTTYFEYVDGVTGDGGIDESWGAPLDVGYEFIQWDSFDGEAKPWVSHPDNVKNFYETGITTNNNIAFSKSGDGYNGRVSMGMTDQKGIIYNTDLRKYNFGGKLNFDLSDKWSVGLSVNYTKTESSNLPSLGYGDANNQIGQLVWSGRNVDFQALKDYENLPLGYASGSDTATPINWNLAYNNNPYWALDNNTNTFDRNRILGNVNITYQITDDLSLTAQTGIDYFSSLDTSRRAFGTYESTRGSYEETQRTRYEINSQAILNYNIDFTEKFNTSLSIGGQSMVNNYHRLYMEASELQVPDVYNISNTRDGVTPGLEQTQTDQKINSGFGIAQFSYDDVVFLDLTGRNDWASVLPTSKNSFFYPGANLSAIVSDMIGMNNSFLKLRAGWAKVGSSGPLSPYSLEPAYSFGTAWGTTPVASSPTTLWNPNIKNETTEEIEVGFDTRLFSNRLRLDFTYYDKETSDVIMAKEISGASGNLYFWDNAATLTNKGFEVTLGADIIRNPGDGFNLGITANFARNRNKAQDIDDDPTTNDGSIVLGGLWNVDIQAKEGEAVGAIYGPAFARNEDGEIIYSNGLPTQDPTYQVLGNINPDWTGGLNIDMSYKNIRFSTLFDVKWGGDIYSQTNSWGNYAGVLAETLPGRETGIVGKGVKSDGNGGWVANDVVQTASTFYGTTYGPNIAEAAVYDASFVKWRELALFYDFPLKKWASTGVNQLSLGVTVRNLAILYKKAPNIDPESAFSNSTGAQGLEYAQVPSTRSIGINLNVKF